MFGSVITSSNSAKGAYLEENIQEWLAKIPVGIFLTNCLYTLEKVKEGKLERDIVCVGRAYII